jgi:hypothetical protein
MVKRTASANDQEPEQQAFELPSVGEHLFQVVDVKDTDDPNIFLAKCEVAQGDEVGRSLLHRCNIDDSQKEFYFTRMFLKAVGEPYKGKGFPIDTDNWSGRLFYATVKHSIDGKYANIKQFNFEKVVEQPVPFDSNEPLEVKKEDIAWDE